MTSALETLTTVFISDVLSIKHSDGVLGCLQQLERSGAAPAAKEPGNSHGVPAEYANSAQGNVIPPANSPAPPPAPPPLLIVLNATCKVAAI